MQFVDRRSIFVSAILSLLLAAGVSTTLTSCGGTTYEGPSIISGSISPSTVQQQDTGMTDECFEVSMTTSGFEDETISQVEIFIVEEPTRSDTAYDELTGVDFDCSSAEEPKYERTGSSLDVGGITKSSLTSNLEAGDYTIGATIETELGTSVTDRGVADLAITE